MSKRKYESFCDDGPKLVIRIADEQEVLEADRIMLQAISGCARAVPQGDQWNLTCLLLNGEPVSRKVLVAWLNSVYQHISGCTFEDQPEAAPTADYLCQLLTFADAVSSSKPLISAIAAEFSDRLVVQGTLGGKEVQLRTSHGFYYFDREEPLRLTNGHPAFPVYMAEAASEGEKTIFLDSIADQVEQLLYIGLRLQLSDFLQKMHHCVNQMMSANLRLWPIRDKVFTPRVVDAAAGSEVGKKVLINGMTGASLWDVLAVPARLPAGMTRVLKFETTLKKAALGGEVGQTVSVEMDLFHENPYLKIGIGHDFEMQLRVGPLEK